MFIMPSPADLRWFQIDKYSKLFAASKDDKQRRFLAARLKEFGINIKDIACTAK